MQVTVGRLLVYLLLVAIGISTEVRAQTRWEITTEYPESNISGAGIATFARLVTERASGRLVISPSYDAVKGVTSREMIAAIQDGRITAGDAFAGPLEATDPVFGLASLPFLVQSIDDAKRLNALARPLYQRALQDRGLKLLYLTIWPSTGLWSNQTVATSQDIRALAVRTYDYNSAEVMRAAGASAIYLPFNEAIERAKTGEINAILSSGDGGAGRKLWDFLHHYTALNYATPISIAMMRVESFNALPGDLQGIVEAAAAETEAHQLVLLSDRAGKNYAQMRENNVFIHETVSDSVMAGLRQAAVSNIAAWRTKVGPEATMILDTALAQGVERR